MNRDLIPTFVRAHYPQALRFASALVLLATGSFVVCAQSSIERGSSTISGTVFDEKGSQPVGRVRVDIRSLNGGEIATAFTDSDGRFHAIGPDTGGQPYIVSVEEPGYEPAEERVDPGEAPEVSLTLRRSTKAEANSSASAGYTVSVNSLQAPPKARKAFEKGLERLQKQDPQGSLAYFKEATNAFPDYYEAFYELGLVNMELRRGDEAERALQKAIDLTKGHNPEPQFLMGALLCDRGEYAQSEQLIRRAMETDTSSWKGHLFLGQALFGENRLEEAEKNAREAISFKPDVAPAYILMANIHIREHKYVDAVKELDTYLQLKPNGPTSDQARQVRAAAQRVLSRVSGVAGAPQLFY